MSMSFSWSSDWMALSTLKSQYSRFLLCRCPSASRASIPYAQACSTGRGSRRPSGVRRSLAISLSDLPPTYSMTMYPSMEPVRWSRCSTKL